MDISRVGGIEPPRRRESERPTVDKYPGDLDEGDPRVWKRYQEFDLGEQIKVEFVEGNIVVRAAAGLQCAPHYLAERLPASALP
jgi:hypothetical protein